MGSGEGGDNDFRIFDKNCTVLLNVGDNNKVTALSVINNVESVYGKGMVYACVPKAGDCYEVTLANKDTSDKLTTGVRIDSKSYDCSLLHSDITVVSFMHLPAYIRDVDIAKQLTDLDIELKGKIKRRYHKGTRCADGTRFVKVKFPEKVKSLNYLMKFNTVYGPQMYRVIHNNQTKVCSCCYSDTHLIKDCPEFTCYRCGVQGHMKRQCEASRCEFCHRYPAKCICEDETYSEDRRYYEMDTDEEQSEQGEDENYDETNEDSEQEHQDVEHEDDDELDLTQSHEEIVVDGEPEEKHEIDSEKKIFNEPEKQTTETLDRPTAAEVSCVEPQLMEEPQVQGKEHLTVNSTQQSIPVQEVTETQEKTTGVDTENAGKDEIQLTFDELHSKKKTSIAKREVKRVKTQIQPYQLAGKKNKNKVDTNK